MVEPKVEMRRVISRSGCSIFWGEVALPSSRIVCENGAELTEPVCKYKVRERSEERSPGFSIKQWGWWNCYKKRKQRLEKEHVLTVVMVRKVHKINFFAFFLLLPGV